MEFLDTFLPDIIICMCCTTIIPLAIITKLGSFSLNVYLQLVYKDDERNEVDCVADCENVRRISQKFLIGKTYSRSEFCGSFNIGQGVWWFLWLWLRIWYWSWWGGTKVKSALNFWIKTFLWVCRRRRLVLFSLANGRTNEGTNDFKICLANL